MFTIETMEPPSWAAATMVRGTILDIIGASCTDPYRMTELIATVMPECNATHYPDETVTPERIAANMSLLPEALQGMVAEGALTLRALVAMLPELRKAYSLIQ